jgi:hypothetical protein
VRSFNLDECLDYRNAQQHTEQILQTGGWPKKRNLAFLTLACPLREETTGRLGAERTEP